MAKSKFVRFIWRVAQFLIVLYVAILIFLFCAQRRLLYVPARDSMDTMTKSAKDHNFEPWLNSAGEYIGWKQISPLKKEHPKLLIVHGNAGCAVERVDYAEGLQNLQPTDIYILEYPGYGARGGSPSQKSFFAAATEAMQLLKGDAPIYIMGESLGTGVAAYLAGSYPDQIAGLLLIAPYDSLTEVAQAHYPFVPVGMLLSDRYPSGTYLKKYHGPVAMRFAGQDVIIPNRFGHKLYDGYNGPKKFWEVPQAGHNDLVGQDQDWWRDVTEFWKSNAPAQ